MPLERITYTQRLHGRMTAVGPGLADVELTTADDTPLGGAPTLASQLVFATARSFREEGTIAFGDGEPAFHLETLAPGDLDVSPDTALRHGTAVLDVRGLGAHAGVRGRITSNFVVADDGTVTDEQVVLLFIDREGGKS